MDAVQKFWVMEDLVEQLLPMLDLPSTQAFVSVNPLALAILEKSYPLWQHLLHRSWQLFLKDFQNVALITDLLKMMKDPDPLLLSCLEYICQSSPFRVSSFPGKIILRLGDNYRVVTPWCFTLMQGMVARMESRMMVVEELHLKSFGGFEVRALASHASCQQQEISVVKFGHGLTFNEEVESWGREDVTNYISLLQNCSSWTVNELFLHSLGESGWRRLAEASAKGEIEFVFTTREALMLGRLVDVRKVWLATKLFWQIIGETFIFEREEEEGEEEWANIEEILEMGGGKHEVKE